MNRITFCAIILVNIIPLAVRAQRENDVYEGILVSSVSGSKLENVICQVVDENMEIIDYTFSDAKGYFRIKKKDNVKQLQFKLLGYSTLNVTRQQFESSDNHVIKLFESSISLEEVSVQVPPIQEANDTLRYNVNSFRTQGDRYVSDVLRKLPGIKVAENGTISYMGESISKFYIEGRDLLGGQYTIASNNLDVDAVSSIEVLQNNQHIKALKGIDFEEKSAINIKLKKGHKARPFGDIQLGVGGSPFLYDGRGMTSYISEGQQTIVSVKGQNDGVPVLEEIEDKQDFNDLFSYEQVVSPFVTAPSARNVSLPTNRYLLNKAYLGTANTLVPVSKDAELKLNVAYGSDKTKHDFDLLQSLATERDYIHVSESSKQKELTKDLRASVSYELNSFSKYIKDEVMCFRKSNDAHSNMISNADSIDIQGCNTMQYIQNNFQGLFKTGNGQAIQVNSLLRYESNKDELEKDNTIANDLSEIFKLRYLISKNKIGTSFDVLKNKLNVNLVATYKQKDIKNNLVYLEAESKQQVKTKYLQIGMEPTYQIHDNSKNLSVTIKLPLYYDNYSTDNSTNEKVVFFPSISATWRVTHKWETFLRIGHSHDYANDMSLLDSPYFTGYRNVYIPSNDLNHNSSMFLASRIQYKDIVNMFFFNMSAMYRKENRNYINVYYITDEYSYYTTKQQDDKGHFLFITADVSKTFPESRLSLGLTPSYTMVKSNILQQDVMTKNNSNAVSVSTTIDWRPIKNINVVHKATGRISWNDNNLTATKHLKDLAQNLGLFFFPTKDINFLVNCDYVIYENTQDEYLDFFFLDLKGTYKHKRMEYELALNNLLNKDLLSVSEISSVNVYTQQIPLRKREFLFSVRFHF